MQSEWASLLGAVLREQRPTRGTAKVGRVVEKGIDVDRQRLERIWAT